MLEGRWDGDRFIATDRPDAESGDTVTLRCPEYNDAWRYGRGCHDCGGSGTVKRVVISVFPKKYPVYKNDRTEYWTEWVIRLEGVN